MARFPRTGKVVISGGGIAGVEALMALRDLGEHRLEIEMISPHPHFVLRPQIIGVPWGGSPMRADLDGLAAQFGARRRPGTIAQVDVDGHAVRLTDDGVVPYDVLLVAVGAVASIGYPSVETVGFGSMSRAMAQQQDARSLAIVVPPGATWTLPAYQLALLARRAGPVTVLTPEEEPAEVFGVGAQPVAEMLERHGIGVVTSCIIPIGSTEVQDLADHIVALPQLRGPEMPGLPGTLGGFIPVDELQQVVRAADVYAAGDAANHHTKQGGLAAHQAEVAATAIVNHLGGEVPAVPEPATLRGKLVLGNEVLYLRRVLDEQDPGTASTEPLWHPEAAMCAWRLTGWMNHHAEELRGDPLGPLAHPEARA